MILYIRQTVCADDEGLIDGEYDQLCIAYISDYVGAGDWVDDPGMIEVEGFNLLDVVPSDGSFAAIDKGVDTSAINAVNDD